MPTLEVPVAQTAHDLPWAKPVRRSSPRPRSRILSISDAQDDHTALRRILENPVWHVATVDSCREAVAFLREAGTCVIFCEHSLPDGSWTRILEVIEDCSAPPLLIVTSRLADDRLWAEVLNLGGFDVLAKPFNEREVRHVLASALTYRANPAPRVQTVGTA